MTKMELNNIYHNMNNVWLRAWERVKKEKDVKFFNPLLHPTALHPPKIAVLND